MNKIRCKKKKNDDVMSVKVCVFIRMEDVRVEAVPVALSNRHSSAS